MNVYGTVVSVENNVTIAKQGGGSYQGTRFAYRDDTGALKEQNFHENTFKFNKGLAGALANLKPGEKFTMVKEKNKNDFWEVKTITTGEVTQMAEAPQSKSYSSPKSNYETPEERAMRQVYIVRQSSLASAINMLGISKKATSTDEVIAVAKQFEAYVMGKEVGQTSFADMDDDVLPE